jgi:hypothetical protein
MYQLVQETNVDMKTLMKPSTDKFCLFLWRSVYEIKNGKIVMKVIANILIIIHKF